MDARTIGITAALASAASWALGSILFKRLGESLSSLAMTLAKGTVSILFLAVALLIIKADPIQLEPLLLLVFSGFLGIAVGDTCFFEALRDLGPHAVVVLMMLGQVLTVLLAVLFLGDTPTLAAWIGIVLVIVGIGVVIFPKLGAGGSLSNIRGIIFGLASVLSMSVSIIVAKKALDTVGTIQATLIRMIAGTVGVFLFGLACRRLEHWVLPLREPKLAIRFVLSVCVVTFGGFWLSIVAIKYVDVSIANTLNSTEPLFVLPLTAILLKEKITLQALLGTLITLGGIVLLCLPAADQMVRTVVGSLGG
jgi:drug/metabolite transporter (DMT)-like permease